MRKSRGFLFAGLLVLVLLGQVSQAGAQMPPPNLVGNWSGTLVAVARAGYFGDPFTKPVQVSMKVFDQEILNNTIFFRGVISYGKPFGLGILVPITGTIENMMDAHLTGDFYFS